MSGKRQQLRYTTRPSIGKGASWDYFEPALLAAWEVARATGEKVTLMHGSTYVGFVGAEGRLYDAELRQVAVCVTPTNVVKT